MPHILRNPLVSVIIPTYNRPDQLVHAVKSVLEQTYTAFEVIVVNDCGIDVSKLLKALNDHRVAHISHKKNKGLAATRNTGIRSAKGKYIAYLDDDDEFYPDHIQTLVDELENNNFKAAYTDGEKCLYEERNDELFLSSKFVEHSSEFDPLRILAQNYIPVLCMMHEKSCLDRIGVFDETMSVHEDWDLWARLSRHFPFMHVKKTTCSYKIIQNAKKNMTTTKKLDFVKTMQQIYRKHQSSTKNIPQFTDFQYKCLMNLTQTLYPNKRTANITIGDNFNIYINGTLLS
ncbi:MAG: glycosyltransferase [Desulfomicrobium apsheronum]|nr:glycosyltransferase [Desulfomicrobium apsheronum]